MVESQTYKQLRYVSDHYEFVTQDIPQPGSGEVLIKVAYSTLNPIDRYQYYLFKAEKLGSDGSGTITAVGDGVSQDLVGKKCAFMLEAWSEYRVVKHDNVILLDDSQDLSKAANAGVNPITAIGLLEIAQAHGATAIVQNAAASQLGKQCIALFRTHGIEVLSIVRKDEQIADLKENHGAKHVLNSESLTFWDDFFPLVKELMPTVFFEYVAGELAGKIFAALPPRSKLVVVGNLTGGKMILDQSNLLFNAKTIESFYALTYLNSKTPEQKQEIFKRISDDLRDGGKIFGSKIVMEINLEDYEKGYEAQLGVASEGKILVKIQ
ncbi:zinc-binding dehydrogenase family protein [Stylonychia lemnae]|uniref:Zinc-binding dehydrogenase family protein n=1 Tax=Stylonychia lemnae TaxID=5949 RepID=A0A078BDI9_STYLE|nr:zinc-binding dehydrogenase family protein [Stylonychia lemnae]|eukprot:CDW91257.1 zinc-binding dehydrogenase family protein [Stylonychia lemnae]